MNKQKEITSHKREFFCDACNQQEPMDALSMRAHLADVHKLTEFKGNRSLLVALDGDFYSNTFEWTFANGVKITEVSSGPKERHW